MIRMGYLSPDVNLKTREQPWLRRFAPLVWIAILQVFVCSIAAASSELHEHLHEGSHEASHHCLVTDLESGSLTSPPVVLIAVPLPVQFDAVEPDSPCGELRAMPCHLCGSLLEHGPPAFA